MLDKEKCIDRINELYDDKKYIECEEAILEGMRYFPEELKFYSMLADIYRNKESGLYNPKLAMENYTIAAEKGDAEAMYNLGVNYHQGLCAKVNPKLCIYWYEKAIEHGCGQAYANLGFVYEDGRLVRKDLKKAEQLYEEGIQKAKSGMCAHNLALMIYNGLIPNGSVNRMFRLFEVAGEYGYADSYATLSSFYFEGEKCQKDEDKAFKFAKLAYDGGSLLGLNNLAICYINGVGTVEDPHKAFELFKEGASKGDTQSTFYLGIAYLDGVGTEQDFALAEDYLVIAARAGHRDAQKLCKEAGVKY